MPLSLRRGSLFSELAGPHQGLYESHDRDFPSRVRSRLSRLLFMATGGHSIVRPGPKRSEESFHLEGLTGERLTRAFLSFFEGVLITGLPATYLEGSVCLLLLATILGRLQHVQRLALRARPDVNDPVVGSCGDHGSVGCAIDAVNEGSISLVVTLVLTVVRLELSNGLVARR